MKEWTVVPCSICKFYNPHDRKCDKDRLPHPVRGFQWCGKGEKK